MAVLGEINLNYHHSSVQSAFTTPRPSYTCNSQWRVILAEIKQDMSDAEASMDITRQLQLINISGGKYKLFTAVIADSIKPITLLTPGIDAGSIMRNGMWYFANQVTFLFGPGRVRSFIMSKQIVNIGSDSCIN